MQRIHGQVRILLAGAYVAVLDGMFAVVLCKAMNPTCTTGRLFRSVATSILGPVARYGGSREAAFGMAIHATVAVSWAAVYWMLYRRSARLKAWTARWPGAALVGAAFGACVWLAMNFLIVPLTGARATPLFSRAFLYLLLGHTVVVGQPIVFTLRDER